MQEFGNVYPQLASPIYPQLARPALKVTQVLQVVTLGKPLGQIWQWGIVQYATLNENSPRKMQGKNYPQFWITRI